MKNLFLVTLVAVLSIFTNCSRNPVTGKKQVVLMSTEQELAMGKEADPQIIQQYGLYEDSSLQQYFRQKGNEMVAISHRSNIQYGFRIINSEVLNAFAVPGGYVYFTRGIMAYFNNEAEFAGVLGHEIGHIAARHSVAQQRNQTLGQIGIIAGMVLSPTLAQFGEAASQGLGLLMLKNGRDDERQADELGVEYSAKIGYDPQHMANFFRTLERQGEGSGQEELPTFLSTHPSPGERLTTVGKLATEWKQKLNLTNPKVNRDNYLRKIEGLIIGEDPKEGFLENGVFYHPPLKFQFSTPTNWAYQNSPTQVQFASKDGKAMMLFTLAPAKTLDEAASAVLTQFKLTQVEARRINVNGFNALAMVADQVQQQGTIRTLSYLIQQGETIYLMLGVTALADFNTYGNLFTNSMESFKTLTDPSKLNKKPARIRIKSVGTSGTLDQALRAYGVTGNKLEQHALLNGMMLADRVNAGTLIKIIGE